MSKRKERKEMANTARKIKEKQEGYGVPIIRIGRRVFRTNIPRLGELITKGYEIRNKIDMLKQQLDETNAAIIEATADVMADADSGSCRVEYFGTECRVQFRESVVISDHQKLKLILGDRFEDLVKVRIAYSPERKLTAMALSDDDRNEDIRGCLEVKEVKATVSYKPMG